MRYAALLPAFILSAFAASHPSPRTGVGQAANNLVAVDATVFADPDSVRQAVSDDLGNHYIVIRVKLMPRDSKVAVSLDDFLLKTDKDGERSHPYAPTQIAGQGVLIVSQVANGGGGGHAQSADPPRWGGVLGGSGSGIGTAATVMGAQGKMQQQETENPLVKILAARMLPEREAAEPVSGLLYFPMEKQKVKDLELSYTTPVGKLIIRFR